MIPFNFDYYKPQTVQEAVNLYQDLSKNKKVPVYYGGGTEIISRARVGNKKFDAVIDIKGISDCNRIFNNDSELIIGAAVELNKVTESKLFPLLGDTVKRIADHTIQCKITIGGNVLGSIQYKESILPLLLSNAQAVIADSNGLTTKNINEVFNKKTLLKDDELLVKFIINHKFIKMPYLHQKKVKMEKIDYPLLTFASLKTNEGIRIAVSGFCEYPLRLIEGEKLINSGTYDSEKIVDAIISSLSEEVVNDQSGTSKYRIFVLKNLIEKALKEFNYND